MPDVLKYQKEAKMGKYVSPVQISDEGKGEKATKKRASLPSIGAGDVR